MTNLKDLIVSQSPLTAASLGPIKVKIGIAAASADDRRRNRIEPPILSALDYVSDMGKADAKELSNLSICQGCLPSQPAHFSNFALGEFARRHLLVRRRHYWCGTAIKMAVRPIRNHHDCPSQLEGVDPKSFSQAPEIATIGHLTAYENHDLVSNQLTESP